MLARRLPPEGERPVVSQEPNRIRVDAAAMFPLNAADRRRSDRFQTRVAVTYRPGIGMPFGRSRTVDIAEGGMCLRTRQRLPLGHHLELDVEVVMPMRVHLGFDADALVIDGPPVIHSARLSGVVRRCTTTRGGYHDVGIELDDSCDLEEVRVLQMYCDTLRDADEPSMFGF